MLNSYCMGAFMSARHTKCIPSWVYCCIVFSQRNNDVYVIVYMCRFTLFAGGRRGMVSLSQVLQFATGTNEEPVLGFSLHPSIQFYEVLPSSSFIPTANTCINSLKLPRASVHIPQPPDAELFLLYDYAFSNMFYGLHWNLLPKHCAYFLPCL